MQAWVLLFRDLNVITRYEYQVLWKIVLDPRLDQTALMFKHFTLTTNRKNESNYRRDFGMNYLKEQALFGRTQLLSTIYWATYILYFYHHPSYVTTRMTLDEFVQEYVQPPPLSQPVVPVPGGDENNNFSTTTTTSTNNNNNNINNNKLHDVAYFQQLDHVELERLVQFRNLLLVGFLIIPPKKSEWLLLRAVSTLERSGRYYPFPGNPSSTTTASSSSSNSSSNSGAEWAEVGGGEHVLAMTRRKIVYQREVQKYLKSKQNA
jgi:hypothetical protein